MHYLFGVLEEDWYGALDVRSVSSHHGPNSNSLVMVVCTAFCSGCFHSTAPDSSGPLCECLCEWAGVEIGRAHV